MKNNRPNLTALVADTPDLLGSYTSLDRSLALLSRQLSGQCRWVSQQSASHRQTVIPRNPDWMGSLLACLDAIFHLQRTGCLQLERMVYGAMRISIHHQNDYSRDWLNANETVLANVEQYLESTCWLLSVSAGKAAGPTRERDNAARLCSLMLRAVEEALIGLNRRVAVQSAIHQHVSGTAEDGVRPLRQFSLSCLDRLERELLVRFAPSLRADKAPLPLWQSLKTIRGILTAYGKEAAPNVAHPVTKPWLNGPASKKNHGHSTHKQKSD